MDSYHYIQLEILKELLFRPEARFRDLNTTGVSNDHFTFHLKQLLNQKLVKKDGTLYSLTDRGMEVAGRLDSQTGRIIKQPKIGVTLGIFRNVNDTLEVLITTRKKNPSIGKIAWFDKKLQFGERLEDAAKRCLQVETGLSTNKFTFMGVVHVIRSRNNSIEIDVVLIHYKVMNPTGTLLKESDDGVNSWVQYDDLLKMKNKITGFNERLDAYMNDQILMQEFVT